jgi:hypothetical protein
MHILLKSLLAEAIQSAYGYWIDRHGNLTVVQNWGDHSKAAESIIYKLSGSKPQLDMATNELMQKYGYVRVAGAESRNSMFYADTLPIMHFDKLSRPQRKALSDIADRFNKELVFNGNKAELNESKYTYSDDDSYEHIINDLLSKFNKITNGLSDGRTVRDEVPNMSSIGASLNDYYISKGIYDIPLSEFGNLSGKHYSKDGTDKINSLVDAIKASNEINPLIVVIDNEGLYILEGRHRSEALYKLGAKSLPAKLVIDKESFDI